MRRIVSASSGAHGQLADLRRSLAGFAVSGMVSVTTSSSSGESAMRSTAPPDSTGCVQ